MLEHIPYLSFYGACLNLGTLLLFNHEIRVAINFSTVMHYFISIYQLLLFEMFPMIQVTARLFSSKAVV